MSGLWSFYGLSSLRASMFIERVTGVIHHGNVSEWKKIHERFGRVRIRSSYGSASPKPVTDLEYSAGLPALPTESVPEWRSPSLRYLLRELVLSAAELKIVSREARPRFQFLELGNATPALVKEDERPELEFLNASIFSAKSIAPPFDFLQNSDGANALLDAEMLERIVELEAQVGLMKALSARLRESGRDAYSKDWEALHHLIHLARATDSLIYYFEPAT